MSRDARRAPRIPGEKRVNRWHVDLTDSEDRVYSAATRALGMSKACLLVSALRSYLEKQTVAAHSPAAVEATDRLQEAGELLLSTGQAMLEASDRMRGNPSPDDLAEFLAAARALQDREAA